MEVEYVKGKPQLYHFTTWEKNIITANLTKEIKVRNLRIERILNDPKNEGQVTFSAKIREIELEIEQFQEIITEFAKPVRIKV